MRILLGALLGALAGYIVCYALKPVNEVQLHTSFDESHHSYCQCARCYMERGI